MRDDIGDRMKDYYESRTRYMLPRRTVTIIRLDGKAFHSYTRGLKEPFDDQLQRDQAEYRDRKRIRTKRNAESGENGHEKKKHAQDSHKRRHVEMVCEGPKKEHRGIRPDGQKIRDKPERFHHVVAFLCQ